MAYHDLVKTAIARLAVRHYVSTGQLSSELNISEGSINRWRNEYLKRYTDGNEDLDAVLTSARENVAKAVGVTPEAVKIMVDLTQD